MKSLLVTTVFFFFVSLISCNSKSDNKEESVDLPAATNMAPVPSEKTESTTTNNAALPVSNNTQPVTLNPEHGKPGHRCDIAVGAPLTVDAAAGKTAPAITPVITPANGAKVKPTLSPLTVVAPGMNPQHGQPGHRCDIAVGAPLDSKPKQ